MKLTHKWLCTLALSILAARDCSAQTSRVYEAYPTEVQASLEARERMVATALSGTVVAAPQFVITNLTHWTPGQTLKVAFNGGDPALRKDIMDAANHWTQFGNIHLDWGYVAATSAFREWSTNDQQYAADIRIGFSAKGYWSMVGSDSVDQSLTPPNRPSLNLNRFDLRRPGNWKAVVLHEFGHALGFEHEHQHPTQGCDDEFRFDDDPEYVPTRDSSGEYIPDAKGRRPGIYTVLSGPLNGWDRAKVDANLRKLKDSHAYTSGDFDRQSIMKYFFEDWMFKSGPDSRCYGPENLELSAQDQVGIARVYPRRSEEMSGTISDKLRILDALEQSQHLSSDLKQRVGSERSMQLSR
jgi:hypothetical protein